MKDKVGIGDREIKRTDLAAAFDVAFAQAQTLIRSGARSDIDQDDKRAVHDATPFSSYSAHLS